MAELRKPEPEIIECRECHYNHDRHGKCPTHFVHRDNVQLLLDCVGTIDKTKTKHLESVCIDNDYPLEVTWRPVEFTIHRPVAGLLSPLPADYQLIEIYEVTGWDELIVAMDHAGQ